MSRVGVGHSDGTEMFRNKTNWRQNESQSRYADDIKFVDVEIFAIHVKNVSCHYSFLAELRSNHEHI